MKQLDEEPVFIIDNSHKDQTGTIIFIDRSSNKQTLITVPDEIQRNDFYPTKDGAVCKLKNNLVLLTNQQVKLQPISSMFTSSLKKRQIIKYDGFLNGYHVFYKEWIRKDRWS